MTHKFIRMILLTGIFVVTSCGATPQKQYAAEMQPAMDLLAKSQADYAKLEGLLTDPGTTSNQVARLQMIELYNMAAQNKIGREDYINLGLVSLDDLISPSAKLLKDGNDALEIVSKVTPVEEARSHHQDVLTCIQARVAFAQELSSALKELRPIDMDTAGGLSNCENFESSLKTLTTFVNDHQ